MPRGGYQKPSQVQPASGPGRFSKRTDGQAIQVPNVGSSPDLQYGDRQRLEAAQRIAPAAKGAEATPAPVSMNGQPRSDKRLPDWLFQMRDNNPAEPVTSGLDVGPGPGSSALRDQPTPVDLREQFLEFWHQTYDNLDAAQMLNDLRAQRATTTAAPQQTNPAPLAAPPPTPPPGTQQPALLQKETAQTLRNAPA